MDRTVVEQFGLNGRPVRFLMGVAALFSVFTLPPITRFTHVEAKWIMLLWLGLASWMMVIHKCCYRRALKSRVAFNVLVFGNVAAGMMVTLTLAMLSRTPDTPLWLGYCVMACVDGATETEPSILLGAFHVLAPFTTVPFFLANGTNRVWAIIGPLICALVSGYGYLLLARRGQRWRQERHERELREAEQRFQRSEREREQLVRDLHDSVASELSLVALLVQTRARDPAHAAELAPILNAARTGLASLRSVLHAIPQAPIQLQLLAAGLMMICEPFARSLGASLQVMVKRGETAILSGHLRTAVVRMFREVVHNALRHGGARRIEVIFEADDDHLYLEVADDGAGFDPATRHAGMGLRGMRERARELGGSFEVASTPGQGTRVWIVSPLRRVECPR